jgi:hypothetical protein
MVRCKAEGHLWPSLRPSGASAAVYVTLGEIHQLCCRMKAGGAHCQRQRRLVVWRPHEDQRGSAAHVWLAAAQRAGPARRRGLRAARRLNLPVSAWCDPLGEADCRLEGQRCGARSAIQSWGHCVVSPLTLAVVLQTRPQSGAPTLRGNRRACAGPMLRDYPSPVSQGLTGSSSPAATGVIRTPHSLTAYSLSRNSVEAIG